jgi:hypothetical protein
MLQKYKERINLLAETLETAGIKQGREQLRSLDDKFCCLGVGCNIYKTHTKKGKWVRNEVHKNYEFVVLGEESSTTMPEAVYKWFGLENEDPYLEGGETAAGFNDGEADVNGWIKRPKTFKQIAKLFRKLAKSD